MRSFIQRLLCVSGIALSLACTGASAQSSSDAIAPSYAPGISGRVVVAPAVGCLVATNCSKPLAKTVVQMLDKASGKLVGQAVTNGSGGFIATVPEGSYVVHVVTPYSTTGYPRCADTAVKVSSTTFTYVSIVCDSGIRT
ncbi:MAG: hypothetical protein QM776_06815 [Rhodocyclaceae bacterium]